MSTTYLPRVFISYRREWATLPNGKRDRRTPDAVTAIQTLLERSGRFTTFIDRRIPGGVEWARYILDQLQGTDLVVVLVHPVPSDPDDPDRRATEDTGWSDWVQREIDFARGEHIEVYPIVLDADAPSDLVVSSLEKLNLSSHQYVYAPPTDQPDAWTTAFAEMTERANQTRRRQRARIHQLQQRLAIPLDLPAYRPADSVPFTLGGAELPVALCFGSGDMTAFRRRSEAIDIIVSSENNFLQMARIHELDTLSGKLRVMGAKRSGISTIVIDAVQAELDAYFPRPGGEPTPYPFRPVSIGSVLATHAGHPDSDLAEGGARYIFHAVTVKADTIEAGVRVVTPIRIEEIPALMAECLKATLLLNRARGLDPARFPGWEDREGESYQPVRSIVFPLFGTGHMGSDSTRVIPVMLDGIARFIRRYHDHPDFSLTAIHLCTLQRGDLDLAVSTAREWAAL